MIDLIDYYVDYYVWCYELQSNMLHQGKIKLVFRSPQTK